MYETILFPTDGSDESLQALDHALDIASKYDATLHALYVVDTRYPYSGIDGGAIDLKPIIKALNEEGEQTIQRIEERAEGAETALVGAIRESRGIHQAILEYADENEVDLIVMGTHGRRGLDRWILGSVTERIVRAADIPVLTVRSTIEPEE